MLFWYVVIALAINSRFTDHPFIFLLIETVVIGTGYYFVIVIDKKRVEEKKKYCKHKALRDSCIICEEENRKLREEFVERHRKETIIKSAKSLSQSEANRIHRNRLQSINTLFQLTPREFEDAIAHLFVVLRYEVTQTPITNDGGKDAIAFKDGKKYFIECKKHGEGNNIGRPMIQKFHSAMTYENAHKGFFVTTAKFTDTAIEYAKSINIDLIDKERLIKLMEYAYPDKVENKFFSQMCLECGSTVEFELLNEDDRESECENGHLIERINPQESQNQAYTKRKKNKKYYRSYRR